MFRDILFTGILVQMYIYKQSVMCIIFLVLNSIALTRSSYTAIILLYIA
jgi:ABC-type glycerol-3-phosphate transport system permease component